MNLTKKLLAVALLASTGLVIAPIADAGGQEKATVCHDGDNGWEAISIADPAVEKHIAHGDASPGDPVPGVFSAVFDDDCSYSAPPPQPPDSDGDGVPDAQDFCPQVGDQGNGVDSSGCPIPALDTDGDGIPDSEDPCPNYPGTTGCLDSDGDGVPNGDDYCPNEGDQGYGLEADGCPVPPPPPNP